MVFNDPRDQVSDFDFRDASDGMIGDHSELEEYMLRPEFIRLMARTGTPPNMAMWSLTMVYPAFNNSTDWSL